MWGRGRWGGFPGPRPTFRGEGQINLVQGLGRGGGGAETGRRGTHLLLTVPIISQPNFKSKLGLLEI